MTIYRFLRIAFLLIYYPAVLSGQQERQDSPGIRILKTYEDYKHQGGIHTGNLDSIDKYIWGAGIEDRVYRFYKGTQFRVEDTSGFIIYSTQLLTEETEMTFHWVPGQENIFPNNLLFVDYSPEQKVKKTYYFSNGLNGDILKLSIENITTSVNDPVFTQAVKKNFKWYKYALNDKMKDGTFIVNRVYNRYRNTIKNKASPGG